MEAAWGFGCGCGCGGSGRRGEEVGGREGSRRVRLVWA